MDMESVALEYAAVALDKSLSSGYAIGACPDVVWLFARLIDDCFWVARLYRYSDEPPEQWKFAREMVEAVAARIRAD